MIRPVLLLILLMLLFNPAIAPPAQSASFTAGTAAQLNTAINDANLTPEADTITLTTNITLTAALPDITSEITIIGGGFTIERAAATAFRIFTVSSTGNFTLNHVRIVGGVAFEGGGVYNEGRTTILDSTFHRNVASLGSADGGAIYNSDFATLVVNRSTFTQNQAAGGRGGAIFNDGEATITNATFDGNSAPSFTGGAIMNFNNMTIRNSTFVNNTADTTRGAITTEPALGTLNVYNSLFANNSPNNCTPGSTFGAGGNNVSTDGSCSFSTVFTSAQLNLGSLSSNGGLTQTIPLLTGSAAIDTGDLVECQLEDQREFRRPVDGNGDTVARCDAGAFEFGASGAVYGSNPAPNATLTVGTTEIGTTISTILTIMEMGTTDLIVSNPVLSGLHSADFSVIGLPTTVGNGDTPQDIVITCTPSANGSRTATLTLSTNDPIQPTVSYTLTCTGAQAGYGSTPPPNTTLNAGSAAVGETIIAPLLISETGAATLNVTLNSITGAHSADFDVINLPLTIANGGATQEVGIACRPSDLGTRTATLTLNTNDPAQPLVSYPLTCTGTQQAGAAFGRVSLLGINQLVLEGNTTVTAEVQLTLPPQFTSTQDVTVEIVDAGAGNATSGADYIAFPPTTVTFPVLSLTPGTTQTRQISLTINEDGDVEGAEALALRLNTLTGVVLTGSPTTHTVIINDDDANNLAQIAFVRSSGLQREDAGTLAFEVQLVIPATYNQTGDITVQISDAGAGNATSGVDYAAFAPTTLTFTAAEIIPGSTLTRPLTLLITDDQLSEGAETVELAITGISGAVEVISPATFTAIINDNERETVTVPGGTVTVPGGTTTIPVPGGDTDYILKSVDMAFATIGDTLTYTIQVRNPKTIPLTRVTIYDVFDARLDNVQLVSTTHGQHTIRENTLIVDGFTLQPGEQATIIVQARLSTRLSSGEVIPNAAVLESPDASVHVSNLVLVGDQAAANDGSAVQTRVVTGLPLTGEAPWWRVYGIPGSLLMLVAGGGWFGLRRRMRK